MAAHRSFLAAMMMLVPGAALADSGTYRVVDTGQTACYGTGSGTRPCPAPGQPLYGQDGNYTINAPRYVDNGDGTVSDPVTGLMWQREFARSVAWSDAQARAAQATTAGHTDWRVPTIKELYSLINFQGRTGSAGPMTQGAPADAVPYLDTRFFSFEYPSSGRYIDAQYITSTRYRGTTMNGQATFFGVNFADGRIKGYPLGGGPGKRGWYLRLVRGNPDYGRNEPRDGGNGTVIDAATGLTWMQEDSGGTAFRAARGHAHYKDGRMDWPEALAFCAGLSLAGAEDWRLPNAKELHSILDFDHSPQSDGRPAIDPLFATSAITDEAGKPNFPAYWTSTTHLDGRIPGESAAIVHFGEALGKLSGRGGFGGPPPMGGPGVGGSMRPPPGMGGGFPGGPPPMGGPGMRGGMHPPPGGGPSGAGPSGAGPSGGGIIDVHGAGAQRSDPKTGDPTAYPVSGHGPQGDVRRVYNHVRCVRGPDSG